MLRFAFPLMPLALAAPAAIAADPLPPREAVVVAQVTIHERITLRVPRMPMAAAPVRAAPPPVVRSWRERKGPKCIAARDLAGASIVAPMAIDLMMMDGRRVRARLDHDCRSIDYYSGLYIRPGSDGQVCADRDSIRVRSGAQCSIETFRLLEPQR